MSLRFRTLLEPQAILGSKEEEVNFGEEGWNGCIMLNAHFLSLSLETEKWGNYAGKTWAEVWYTRYRINAPLNPLNTYLYKHVKVIHVVFRGNVVSWCHYICMGL